MKVTVYLGANMGDNPSFKKATIALGQWIAKKGHTLVYGGSKMGLMGVLGDTVLENGGEAHGIMPQFLFTDDFSEIEAFVQSYMPPQLRRYR